MAETTVKFENDSEAHDFASQLLEMMNHSDILTYDYSKVCEVSFVVTYERGEEEHNELLNKINELW